MIRSRSSYGRDGGAIRSNPLRIARNANLDRRSLSPRGTTNVRTALNTTRTADASPNPNTTTRSAITRAGSRSPFAPRAARRRACPDCNAAAKRSASPNGCAHRPMTTMRRIRPGPPGPAPAMGDPMLWTILVILIVLWALGLIGSIGGSFIHLLLVLAVIVLAVQLLQGRRSV